MTKNGILISGLWLLRYALLLAISPRQVRSKKEKMFPTPLLAKHVLLHQMEAETNLFQCCCGLGLVCDLNLGQNWGQSSYPFFSLAGYLFNSFTDDNKG